MRGGDGGVRGGKARGVELVRLGARQVDLLRQSTQRAHSNLQRAIGGLLLLQLVGAGGAQRAPGKKEAHAQNQVENQQQRDPGDMQVEQAEQVAA